MVSFTYHYNAIFIDRFPSKTEFGKDSWYFNNSLLCKPQFSSATKTFLFFVKTHKKTTSLQQVWWEYTKSCFKENVKIFSKNSTTHKNITTEVRLQNLYKKENFKPEIKPMIENLQDELYQLESKQAKDAKLRANIRSWRAKNAPKLSSKYLKDRIWKIKQYLNYILMIINQNILAILWTFLNLQKKLWNSTPSELPQLLLLNLFAKFLTERKYLINTLIFVRLKYL